MHEGKEGGGGVTHRSTWKSLERAVARTLGGKRIIDDGSHNRPDVVTELLSIECKLRARLPKLLTDAMAQARGAAACDRLPVAVLKEKGAPVADAIVCMRLGDFAELYGGNVAKEG